MKDKKKYEIINPSDKCFIYSDNLRVAKFCCLLLGNGRYGLTDCETNETAFSIYLFGISEEQIVKEFGEPLDKFMEHNKVEIVECFKSFEYPYERTSLNNIGERARLFAQKLGE